MQRADHDEHVAVALAERADLRNPVAIALVDQCFVQLGKLRVFAQQQRFEFLRAAFTPRRRKCIELPRHLLAFRQGQVEKPRLFLRGEVVEDRQLEVHRLEPFDRLAVRLRPCLQLLFDARVDVESRGVHLRDGQHQRHDPGLEPIQHRRRQSEFRALLDNPTPAGLAERAAQAAARRIGAVGRGEGRACLRIEIVEIDLHDELSGIAIGALHGCGKLCRIRPQQMHRACEVDRVALAAQFPDESRIGRRTRRGRSGEQRARQQASGDEAANGAEVA